MVKITFLGTGHAMPRRSRCTSTLIQDDKSNILLDVGGGVEIFSAFTQAGISPTQVKHVMISHWDSDHILGFVPLVRAWRRWEPRPEKIIIFCSEDVKKAIDVLFTFTAANHYAAVKDILDFKIVKDGDSVDSESWNFRFFDVGSEGSPQMGCVLNTSEDKKIVFPGDEALREHALGLAKDADLLLHEAFCVDEDEPVYKAHAKQHGTCAEAAIIAKKVSAKRLAVYHMEDDTLETRKKRYGEDASKYYDGEIIVPFDGDIYEF